MLSPVCVVHSSRFRFRKIQKPVLPVPGGGEATTYTRLPLKHDYSAPSPLSSPEIKLSETAPPITRLLRNRKPQNIKQDDVVFEYSDSEPESDNKYEAFDFSGYENVDEGEEETLSVREKGVPAVMRCFDRAKIYVKSGDSGNGMVAFLSLFKSHGERRSEYKHGVSRSTFREIEILRFLGEFHMTQF
ncbi:hypothetical protein JHK84_040751 [Glycine max]|nr:hypothetical protein JHK86_040539 [Glycine max]KAG5122411.1 hypothetical protein JHK84_040751 [Glycine max]